MLFKPSKLIFLIIATGFILVINSCQKQPGDGGLATIHGKVYSYQFDKYYQVIDSGYHANTTVYLSYGNHTWEDQTTKSSYTGEYAFPYLHTGDYTIWVLNKCDSCNLNQSYDIVHVTIDKPRETVEVRDLINFF